METIKLILGRVIISLGACWLFALWHKFRELKPAQEPELSGVRHASHNHQLIDLL